MTRQNKTVPKLVIRLGYGYPINKNTQQHLYPPDTLTAFLNVDSSDESQIINFCNNYTYIPRHLESNLISGFIIDQNELKDLAFKINNESLSESDLKALNSYLETIHPKITVLADKDAHAFNKELGNDSLPQITKKYLIENVSTGGTFVKLCSDLIRTVIEKQNLKQCLNCGKFILINMVKPRKFCDNNNLCKYAYKQRKLRRKRKGIIINNTPVRTLV